MNDSSSTIKTFTKTFAVEVDDEDQHVMRAEETEILSSTDRQIIGLGSMRFSEVLDKIANSGNCRLKLLPNGSWHQAPTGQGSTWYYFEKVLEVDYNKYRG